MEIKREMSMKDLEVSQVCSENTSQPDIIGNLEAYEKLKEQYRRYGSLKQNVEKERKSVQLHIYERVSAEYQEKMSALERNLEVQEALLQERIKDLLQKRAELDKLCRKDAERLEEIDFRTRVGEFSEEECRQERSAIEQRTLNQSQELALLEEIVSRCTKSGLLPEPASSDRPPEPEEESEEGQKENAEPEQASPQPSEAEEEAAEPQSADPEADPEEFQIVEESPCADDQHSPVVHCPPTLSTEASGERRVSGAAKDRRGWTPNPRSSVTGYLVALEGSRQGERFPMISSNITLGSSPGIDIRLVDSGIANFHARIRYKERKHFLENLDSMGRSFVNGVQASDLVELKDGDVIRLGDIKMQVEYASSTRTHSN
jgi:FHA domain